MQIPRRIKDARHRIPKETMDDYRQFYFRSDVAQTRVIVLLFAVGIGALGFSDYFSLGISSEFYVLEILRIGLLFYSVFEIFYLSHFKDYRSYDRSLFVYLLIFVIFSLLVNVTRPFSFAIQTVIVGVSIFAFYLAIPTKFLNQALLSLTYSGGEFALILYANGLTAGPSELSTAVFGLIFANIIGAAGSWQLHTFRYRVFADFNERKKTEQLTAIGQTAGMIGHDIRSPLQAITNELYFAKDSMENTMLPEEVKKEALQSLNIVQEQTDYISKIVADLQDYARPIIPEYTQVRLFEFTNSILQTLTFPESVRQTVNIDNTLLMKTDQTLLRRILSNLINNAMQAMPEGGKLEIEAKQKDHITEITVADTGNGIPEEVKKKLFTPLVTTKAKGQGFGLAVVKRLVDALNGQITFESQTGKGTKFIITLPVKE
jgi:signal transduction histidine kinase